MISLWVPGRFKLTNAMLSDLRAAGYYEGRGFRTEIRPRRDYDRFSAETSGIRLAVKAAVTRASALPRALRFRGRRCALRFNVCGHFRHDVDAWYLFAKAALDGLVDAGVFTSDRFDVAETSGRVYRTMDEQEAAGHSAHAEGVQVLLEWEGAGP